VKSGIDCPDLFILVGALSSDVVSTYDSRSIQLEVDHGRREELIRSQSIGLKFWCRHAWAEVGKMRLRFHVVMCSCNAPCSAYHTDIVVLQWLCTHQVKGTWELNLRVTLWWHISRSCSCFPVHGVYLGLRCILFMLWLDASIKMLSFITVSWLEMFTFDTSQLTSENVMRSVHVFNVSFSVMLCSILYVLCCLCMQCSFFDHHGRKILYRRYGTLYFVVGITADEVCRHLKIYNDFSIAADYWRMLTFCLMPSLSKY
jgi:hypothetical protein